MNIGNYFIVGTTKQIFFTWSIVDLTRGISEHYNVRIFYIKLIIFLAVIMQKVKFKFVDVMLANCVSYDTISIEIDVF